MPISPKTIVALSLHGLTMFLGGISFACVRVISAKLSECPLVILVRNINIQRICKICKAFIPFGWIKP